MEKGNGAIWRFRKIIEDGVSSCASRMTQGIFVAHHDRTEKRERAGPPLPRTVVERAPEVEAKRFYVLSADIEAQGHTGGCPRCASLAKKR